MRGSTRQRCAAALSGAVLAWFASVAGPSFGQSKGNNGYYQQQQQQQQQQWQRQQDQQRQQQQEQQRQQQAMQRQQLQDQMRQQQQAQMRQQMQEQQRQQMQAQQRQQMQTQQQNQQRQTQRQQQTAQQQRQQMQQQGKLGTMQGGKPTGLVVAGGVARMVRPLTPGEIQRGFTGKVTPDGRALIRFQGRVLTVPASRVSGLGSRLAAQQGSQQAKPTRWTPSQQAAVGQRAQALKAIDTSRASARVAGGQGGGAGCTPPNSPRCQFNRVAPVTRIDYSQGFEADLKNFDKGHEHFSGPLKEDLILVQYHRGDRSVGVGRSLIWWTSHRQANGLTSEEDIRRNLALPKDWGPRDNVSIARIPKGTVVEYIHGTAAEQQGKGEPVYEGGGTQYRFKDFDSSWVLEQRGMDPQASQLDWKLKPDNK